MPELKQSSLTESALPADSAVKQRRIDQTAICMIMCCCNEKSSQGWNDQNLMQHCADQVLKEADKALEWKSR